MTSDTKKIPRSVGIWLMLGVVMLLVQILLGGITRLTDSGLSITQWEVVIGTLPPMNETQWQEAFDLYKIHAKKQYESVFGGDEMTLSQFKGIYFWEYTHRLWARLMGLAFLIPLIYFAARRYLNRRLSIRLGLIFVLAGLVASLGWIMVVSGLNTDAYAWVSPYKLVLHLSAAILLITYVFATGLQVLQPSPLDTHNKRLARFASRIDKVIWLQLILGGLMAGMKAGGFYPHFPHMQTSADGSWIWIADALKVKEHWSWSSFSDFDNHFAPALVQLLHRLTAYLLCLLVPVFFMTLRRVQTSKTLRIGGWLLLGVLIIQILLGIFTLVNCLGHRVPVALGALHQLFGILLLLALRFVRHQIGKQR